MLEAMRILKKAYPNPKRTILVGHWGGEEQGLNGSRALLKIIQQLLKILKQFLIKIMEQVELSI